MSEFILSVFYIVLYIFIDIDDGILDYAVKNANKKVNGNITFFKFIFGMKFNIKIFFEYIGSKSSSSVTLTKQQLWNYLVKNNFYLWNLFEVYVPILLNERLNAYSKQFDKLLTYYDDNLCIDTASVTTRVLYVTKALIKSFLFLFNKLVVRLSPIVKASKNLINYLSHLFLDWHSLWGSPIILESVSSNIYTIWLNRVYDTAQVVDHLTKDDLKISTYNTMFATYSNNRNRFNKKPFNNFTRKKPPGTKKIKVFIPKKLTSFLKEKGHYYTDKKWKAYCQYYNAGFCRIKKQSCYSGKHACIWCDGFHPLVKCPRFNGDNNGADDAPPVVNGD